MYTDMKICTYNIISGGANRLEQAMRCVDLMNIDIGGRKTHCSM
jgi:hypothetical protein